MVFVFILIFLPSHKGENDYIGFQNKIKDIINNVSDSGVNLIKKYEGFVSHAYLDSDGNYIIGYGTRIPNESYLTKKITEKHATKLLKTHVNKYVNPILKKSVKVDLSQKQYDALSSLIYNIGPTKFMKSKLLKSINEGDDEMIIKSHWSQFNTSVGKVLPGLVKRRSEEITLFFSESI